MNAAPPTRVRIGAFELDLRTGELGSRGRKVVLQEQPFRVLLMLARREGQIATREEIQKELWPNDTVVEFDHAINTVIANLRRLLGDSVAANKYIETVARRGYRLVVPVEWTSLSEDHAGNKTVQANKVAELSSKALPIIGKKVAHYRVLAIVGGGGMGLVFEAEDIKLGRRVALKFLPEELAKDPTTLKRFEREARTASLLSHVNICTIFEVEEHAGQPFIVMELLQGKTLRDLLANANQAIPLELVLDIAVQVCEGLEAAHGKGIIHRDIKPANIFLTNSGHVKILDFGLAKLTTPDTDGHQQADAITETHLSGNGSVEENLLTRTHQMMGTMGYMSPEQIRGEKLDLRSDIFSFAAVLYELLARERAFGGATVGVVQDAILHRSPPALRDRNPVLPGRLEQLIFRALEKDRERRPQSAKELLAELKELKRSAESGSTPAQAVSAPQRIRSLAVLPLVNLSGDPQQQYFADGMTEELTAGLAQISALRVVSRTSAMRYRGANKSIPEIARELKVDAIIEGSVLRDNRQVRVTVQMIEAATDSHLWARSYERDLQDVLRLQNEVARSIASEIQLKLTPAEEKRLSRQEVLDPAAHDDFLRGQVLAAKRTGPDQWQAISLYESTVRRYPNFVPAYIALADVYRTLALNSNVAPREVYPKALAAGQRAVELDPQRAEAHVVLAVVTAEYEWDWTRATEIFQKAIRLNPNSMLAHSHYGHCLGRLGDADNAVREARIGSELDPLDPRGTFLLAVCTYQARRYAEAAKLLQTGAELYPNFWPMRLYLAKTLVELGQASKALKEFRKAGDFTAEAYATIGYTYGRVGRAAEAGKVIAKLKRRSASEYIASSLIARIHGALGEKDEAFAWFDKACEERDTRLTFLRADPTSDSIRSDSRFAGLLRRVGFQA
jgi:serine/threonine protein kinase